MSPEELATLETSIRAGMVLGREKALELVRYAQRAAGLTLCDVLERLGGDGAAACQWRGDPKPYEEICGEILRLVAWREEREVDAGNARIARIEAACALSDEEARFYVKASSALNTDIHAWTLGKVLQRIREAVEAK